MCAWKLGRRSAPVMKRDESGRHCWRGLSHHLPLHLRPGGEPGCLQPRLSQTTSFLRLLLLLLLTPRKGPGKASLLHKPASFLPARIPAIDLGLVGAIRFRDQLCHAHRPISHVGIRQSQAAHQTSLYRKPRQRGRHTTTPTQLPAVPSPDVPLCIAGHPTISAGTSNAYGGH